MLTDRQFVALQLFANITSKLVFVKNIRDEESIKRVADSALLYADIFLKQSEGNIDTDVIEQDFKNISDKLEEMNQLSQRMSENNKDLLDLVNNNIEKQVEIELGAIAWIDGEPLYVEEFYAGKGE